MGPDAIVGPLDMVILLPALPAELDRHEKLALARLKLPLQGEFTPVGRFNGGVQGPTLRDELVQLEREGSPSICTIEFAATIQQGSKWFLAFARRSADDLGQLARGLGQSL